MFQHPTIGRFVPFNVVSSSAGRSLWFLPESNAPGLSHHLLRVDLIPAAMTSIDRLATTALQGVRDLVGAEYHSASALSGHPGEVVLHEQVRHHPVFGNHDVLTRLQRSAGWFIAPQLICKLDGLHSEGVAEGAAFLSAMDLDEDVLIGLDRSDAPFVQSAMEGTRALRELQARATPDMDLSGVPGLLARASPVHEQFTWASFAILCVGEMIGRGDIDDFDIGLRMAGLAGLFFFADFDPAYESPALRRLELRCYDHLATLLLYTMDRDPRHRSARAAALWHTCAADGPAVDFGPVAEHAAKSAFADALTDMDVNGPLDVELGAVIEAVRAHPDAVDTAVDALLDVSSNLAHVGRRIERGHAQLFGACIGCDLAQVLVESAITDGGLETQQSILERMVPIFQEQLDTQSTLYGISRPEWDGLVREAAPRPARTLFFLRPLRTSRRMMVPNRFPRPRTQQRAFLMLPDPISIEAALHWAVHRDFDTHALGGPIDIFGMGRSTMLSSNPDGWQMAAGIRIDQADLLCVLPAHTNGLLWELEQIVEAGARERVLFVLPPDGDASAKLPHPTTRLLGDLGFDLPAEFGPGCAMCAPDGTVDMKLQFGALWDGTLRRALLARVDGRGTELGEP